MKLLVCGDRNWTDREYMYRVLDELHDKHGITLLIHGANGYDEDGKSSYYSGKPTVRGVDMIAHEWAQSRGIPVDAHPANWKKRGKAAGPIRNREMLALKPDYVVGFHPGIHRSKGTRDMIRISLEAGIKTEVYGQRLRLGDL